MKRGCTVTMLQQNYSLRIRWEIPRHDQKITSESLNCEGDIDFFYWKGIFHHEFVLRDWTFNK